MLNKDNSIRFNYIKFKPNDLNILEFCLKENKIPSGSGIMNSLPKKKYLKARETVFQHKHKKLSISFEVRLEHLEDLNEHETLKWTANTRYYLQKMDFAEEDNF
ncbi:hypothetical protein DMUE_1756 [Dictyocoela muelleri]|nr:hypothetical protein DMUE_1756 [Dictyocoela muelleri]